MVIKVYISGISGNKEVKKRQQRVLLILDSKNVKYEVLDIAEPNMEEAKEYMQNNSTFMGSTIGDPNPRHPLPPQIYNDEEYCGDYDAFDMANEIDEMEKFLKLAPSDSIVTSNAEVKLENGDIWNTDKEEKHDPSQEKETPNESANPKLEEVEGNNVPQSDNIKESEEQAEEKQEEPSDHHINETDDQKIENGSKEGEAIEDANETNKSEEE